jgi:plasmid stabilization system protein ParE
MNWTVVWLPRAENRLAELWTNAMDRNAVRDAADRIDQLLEHDPMNQGESRGGRLRILFERPLAVYFAVDQQSRVVSVTRVWRVSS